MDLTLVTPPTAKLVELRDGTLFPDLFSVTVFRKGVHPLVELTIEVKDGKPALMQFAVKGFGELVLTPTMIRKVNVSDMFESTVRAVAAMAEASPQSVLTMSAAANPTAGERAAVLARRGRPVDDTTLRRVAKIVKAHRDINYREEVANQIPTSLRTASRYIDAAKKKGYLTEEDFHVR